MHCFTADKGQNISDLDRDNSGSEYHESKSLTPPKTGENL